jgi:hypothetical protein
VYTLDTFSQNSSYNEKCIIQKLRKKSKHILFAETCSENLAACDNMEKYGTAKNSTQMTV